MNLQAKNSIQYKQAGEILYALEIAKNVSDGVVSKVALQKLMYLSVVLGPIKEVIINFIRYEYNVRGPYNYEVQNIVDHLMGLGYVEISNYDYKDEKRIMISYKITPKGSSTVKRLIRLDSENEKYWWISCIFRLAKGYSDDIAVSKWSGLDKIVDLVYKDPTFVKGKTESTFRTSLDISGSQDVTKELIEFTKQYIASEPNLKIVNRSERRMAEIILVLFFEMMFNKVIGTHAN